MKVREYRIVAGYTQAEIAILLGITQSAYSMKEANKREFSINELKILKEILNVTYDELLN